MSGMSNQISNVLGVAIPADLRTQMRMRSIKNVSNSAENLNRSNEDLIYMANKTAWVRLVSSVDVRGEELQYYKKYFPQVNLTERDSLAKNFVLFAGTSTYNKNTSASGFEYTLKSGFGAGGAYGTLGTIEIQNYGYSPMPGIIDVRVDTQGKLGSIRAATINFKVWNKMQLDVVESLYFKVGYLMFLEWGHSVYYDNSGKLQTSDYNKIDPFKANIKKEDILRSIATNVQKTNGNYDAMLGMCTQFNFSMNQEGGFDCSVKLMALGSLADGIKTNQPQTLPPVIKQSIATIVETENARLRAEARAAALKEAQAAQAAAPSANPATVPAPKQTIKEWAIASNPGTYSGDVSGKPKYDQYLLPDVNTTLVQMTTVSGKMDPGLGLTRLGLFLYRDKDKNEDFYSQYILDATTFRSATSWMVSFINTQGGKLLEGPDHKDSSGNMIKTKAAYWDDPAVLEFNGGKILGGGIYTGVGNAAFPFRIQILVPNSINPDILDTYDATTGASKKAQYIWDLFKQKFQNGQENYPINPADVDIAIKSAPHTISEIGSVGDLSKERKYLNQGKIEIPGFLDQNIIKSPNGSSVFLGLRFKIDYETDKPDKENKADSAGNITKVDKVVNGKKVYLKDKFEVFWSFYSSGPIIEVTPKPIAITFKEYEDKLAAQNTAAAGPPPKTPEQIANEAADAVSTIDVNAVQKEESLKYQSGLDVFLRATQLRSYIKAKDKAATGQIVKLDLTQEGFIKSVFDNGVLQNIISDLTNDNYIQANKTILDTDTGRKLFEKFALYGFNHNVMSRPIGENLSDFPTVNFKELFESYVVPYKVSHGIVSGVSANYPVYIKLGLLFMVLNHMCTIYDSPEGTDIKQEQQTPLMYLDFNPETNFCLSEPLQMSTDTFKFLIPFRGTKSEFKDLFSVITPEYNPETENYLSSYLPPFKGLKPDAGDAYRGKIMNVLVNLDYLLNLCKSFAANDESQSVNLKPFLQQIIDDMNKYMGNINLFRLAYDDRSNCMYICDDQVQPLQEGEAQHYVTNLLGKDADTSDIPLYGKYSIARSFEIKTEISNKLANMIAISANSDIKSDSSKDGTPFGQYNQNYIDRYKPQATSIGSKKGKEATKNKKPLKTDDEKKAIVESEKMFESFVKNQFKGTEPITEESIPHATNYYIEKMNKLKGEREGTKSSALLPISVNFTMDGIAGFSMGHAFTVPKELLPYSYTRTKDYSKFGILGFVVTGLSNTLQGNSWTTDVKANMMFLKNADAFKSPPSEYNIQELQNGNFQVFPEGTLTDRASTYQGGSYVTGGDPNRAKYIEAALNKLPDKATFMAEIDKLAAEFGTSAQDFYRIMYAESGIEPDNVNEDGGATGLIQFMPNTAIGLGTTTSRIKQMSATEQVPLIRKYFKNGGLKQGATVFDMYTIVFFPLMRGKSDDWIVQSKDLSAEKISRSNGGIARKSGKNPGDPLTVADFRTYVNSIM